MAKGKLSKKKDAEIRVVCLQMAESFSGSAQSRLNNAQALYDWVMNKGGE